METENTKQVSAFSNPRKPKSENEFPQRRKGRVRKENLLRKIIYKKENLQESEIIKSRFIRKRNSEGETNGYGNTGKDPERGN